MKNFIIEIASESDIENIITIIQKVLNNMPNSDWFAADNAEYIHEILKKKKGTCYKAIEIETGKTAGIFIVTYPGESEENLGYDIGLQLSELKYVAHMDTAAVLPEYRGNKLQFSFMEKAELDLKKFGYRFLMCTIHPQNIYSKNIAISQGYKVMTTKEKYGGYVRNILLKEIH